MYDRARVAFLLTAACLYTVPAVAEPFHRGNVDFEALRAVDIPEAKTYSVVVTDFLCHGLLSADGRNVVVSVRNRDMVPTRVLQLGPGDFCRLAFQPVRGQNEYEILYGGPSRRKTCRRGRATTACCWKPASTRSAIWRSWSRCGRRSRRPGRMGADYVDGVRHASNPVSARPGPFFSHYSGYLTCRRPAPMPSGPPARIAASC